MPLLSVNLKYIYGLSFSAVRPQSIWTSNWKSLLQGCKHGTKVCSAAPHSIMISLYYAVLKFYSFSTYFLLPSWSPKIKLTLHLQLVFETPPTLLINFSSAPKPSKLSYTTKTYSFITLYPTTSFIKTTSLIKIASGSNSTTIVSSWSADSFRTFHCFWFSIPLFFISYFRNPTLEVKVYYYIEMNYQNIFI